MTSARLGAAWTAGAAKSNESPAGDHRSGGDEGGETTPMAPRPSSTPPTSASSFAPRQTALAEETGETPAQRQTRILAGYKTGKPGQRVTAITRLLDQAG